MMNRNALVTPLFFLLLSFFITSCMAPQKLPQDHYYRLPELTGAPLAEPVFQGLLGVTRMRTDGMLNERAMLYVEEQRPVEIHRSKYNYWQEVPSVLIQKDMVSYFDRIQAAGQVVSAGTGMGVDWRITGHLLRFEMVHGKDESRVRVDLELVAAKRGGQDQRIIKNYRMSKICADNSISAAAETFGLVLHEIYDQFLHDVGTVK